MHNFVHQTSFLANFCKKKFRTLRERFTRELRKSYLEPSALVKYEYFKELSFLSPYIKFRSITFESSADGKTVITKREVSPEKDTVDDIKMLEQSGYFAEEQEHHTYMAQETGGAQNIIYETTTVEHVPDFSGSQNHEVVSQSDDENLSSPKPQSSQARKRKSPNWEDELNDHDDNKYFAMSVACSLKRLSTINNLKAKVEIFQVLEKFSSKQEQEKK